MAENNADTVREPQQTHRAPPREETELSHPLQPIHPEPQQEKEGEEAAPGPPPQTNQCSQDEAVDIDKAEIIPDNWNYKTLVGNYRFSFWYWYSQFCIVTQTTHKCEWIEHLLQSNTFSEFRKDGEISKFEVHGDINFKKKISSYSCVIFCFENGVWDDKVLEDVKTLSSYYALRNVIVLLGGGREDPGLCEQQTEIRSWCKDQKYDCSFEILPLTDSDITWSREHLMSYEKKMGRIRQLIEGASSYTSYLKCPVGIFSRSLESDYEWLNSWLKSGSCQTVEDVRPCYISNNGFRQFIEDVSQCKFGILYHTKNRGRINITDVTDSLYDTELQQMSERLGKDNVIVVVDDLQNSSDEEKHWIQDTQPKIKEMAADVFLFSTDERTYLEKLITIRKIIKRGPTSQD